MRVAWCWLLLAVAGAVAEPLAVFEDARAGEAPPARLHLGGRQARTAAARALLLTDDHPFGRTGNALRLSLDAEVQGWQLDLPIPPVGIPRVELAAGRLTLAVRGDAAGVEVGLVDAAVPQHTVRVPLARYGAIEPGWTLYRIPIDDLLALAPELALDQLECVELCSAWPGPVRLDIDHVWLEPGPVPPAAPVRTVIDTDVPAGEPVRPAEHARYVSLRPAGPTPPRVGNGTAAPAPPPEGG